MPTRGGEVIPAKTTTMEDGQLDTLESTAMKLPRGNRGLRLVGPHGAGKNYLLKYIHYQRDPEIPLTNNHAERLLRNVVVHRKRWGCSVAIGLQLKESHAIRVKGMITLRTAVRPSISSGIAVIFFLFPEL